MEYALANTGNGTESSDADGLLFDDRPFHERKAALNLVQMAQPEAFALSPDRVRNLIKTLVVSSSIEIYMTVLAK